MTEGYDGGMNLARYLPALLALLCLAIPGMAETPVYKSVDEAGNVTYSDRPPSDAVQTETMTIEKPQDTGNTPDAKTRQERMKKQADELARSRKEREAEREKRAREKTPPSPPAPANPQDERTVEHDGFYWPGYPYRPPAYRPPHRPPHQRPPGQRPPVKPRPPGQRPPAQRPPVQRPPVQRPPPPTIQPH